jgi:phosphatidylglycerophosphate synthase
LTSRSTRWAQQLSRALARTSITPNQISAFSVLASGAALGVLSLSTRVDSAMTTAICLLLGAVLCQLRLLCNLMDGMVAIEAGKQTPDGVVWNELPDRVADILILVGVGIAAHSPVLGWAAAVFAVFVAYVRELGKGIDGVVDFSGPMAKPHRMALVSGALVLAALITFVSPSATAWVQSGLRVTLWVLCAGCVLTLYRRTHHLLGRLL